MASSLRRNPFISYINGIFWFQVQCCKLNLNRISVTFCLQAGALLHNEQKVKVSDTTKPHSSNVAGFIKEIALV
ncbi:MAG TPA: hypothetical protein PLP23_03880 [Panacibacter sp.]|nr:hypothetical protein [Panacibacter sp.]